MLTPEFQFQEINLSTQYPPGSPSEPAQQGGSWRPADHYETAPAPEQKRGCPKWVPIGCGGGGCLLLIAVIGFGYYAARNLPRLMNYYVNSAIEQNADPSVTAEQKQALRFEMERFQRNFNTNKEAAANEAQAIMQEMRRAMGDQRITPEEIDDLTRRLREINDRLENKTGSTVGFELRVPGFEFGDA